MLSYEEMPEDNKDLAKVEVAFPRLQEDNSARCRVPMSGIVKYLTVEDEDVSEADLVFVRTAQVAESRFWIWRLGLPMQKAGSAMRRWKSEGAL